MATARNVLSRFEALNPIGEGRMGRVFVASDPKLGRKVAIKMLPSRVTSQPDTLRRFTQEARAASALNHPNIVTVHEVRASEDESFIVMEYVQGRDLRAILDEGPLPVREAIEIGAQIANGLAAAHERGIVHRDLKPENIMVTPDGSVKILDFGLANFLTAAQFNTDKADAYFETADTGPRVILGTLNYMSPEQATGRHLDFRSDQFSFGAILYEIITGRPPFQGETAIDTLAAMLHSEPPPIASSEPRVPPLLSMVVTRLLAKAANSRYSSTRELAEDFRQLLADDSHEVSVDASAATETALDTLTVELDRMLQGARSYRLELLAQREWARGFQSDAAPEVNSK
jgi:serine/threonine protein kinase